MAFCQFFFGFICFNNLLNQFVSDNIFYAHFDNTDSFDIPKQPDCFGQTGNFTGRKIGLDTDAILEIVDLRMDPAKREELLTREHYYPGWHMNKNSWYTLVLDGRVPDEELFRRMAESYELAKA